MKYLALILICALQFASTLPASLVALAQTSMQSPPTSSQPPSHPASVPLDVANAQKARALLNQAIHALGGQAWLGIRDIEQSGRSFTFFHGRPTSNGIVFWRFVEFPDKERIELTKQRDVAQVYNGNKGYEITYKGAHEIEKKDLDDYFRRRKFSIDTVLRTWVNDPSVALFYDGAALAGNLAALQVTLINSKDEAVHLFFDPDTHLPLKKTYSWRDAVDQERDTEEEIWDNYRLVQGIMTAWGFTRYYNGDMQSERFLQDVHYNQGVNETMFDPNSGYDPNKVDSKHKK